MHRPVPAILLAILMSGCLGPGPVPGRIGPRTPTTPSDGGAPLALLFISPMGEPFRARPGQPYPSFNWFVGADADHDGVLTRSEFIEDAVRFFDLLDQEHAGVLSNADIVRYETVLAPEITYSPPMPAGPDAMVGPPEGGGMGPGGMGPGRAGPGRTAPQGAALYGWLPFPEPVVSAHQTYGDRITRQRFAAAAGARFDMLTSGVGGPLLLKSLPRTPIQSMTRGRGIAR